MTAGRGKREAGSERGGGKGGGARAAERVRDAGRAKQERVQQARDELPLVAVYADESCLGNGREGSNPGGAAGVIEVPRAGGAIARYDYWVSEPATTNNRMALRSVIEAFRVLSAKGRRLRVVFTSDSQYLVKGMTEWVHGWAMRGWRRREGEIENLSLWLDAVEAARGHDVQWRWVRGHAGHAQNEYADHLANRAAAEQTRAARVSSQFGAWLEARRAKPRGARISEPAPFPDSDTFRPDRPLPAVESGRR
jgi:ribonuclease HI